MNSNQLTWALDLLEEAAQFMIDKEAHDIPLAMYFCKLSSEWTKELKASYE